MASSTTSFARRALGPAGGLRGRVGGGTLSLPPAAGEVGSRRLHYQISLNAEKLRLVYATQLKVTAETTVDDATSSY